jgi:hypothetical protein
MLAGVTTSRSEEMTVPGNLLALMLFAVVGVAQAVEFDARIKAPKAVTNADLKAKYADVAAKFSGPGAVNAIEAVHDRGLAKDRIDARWMLGALVDAHAPLTELEDLGLKPRGDGSYTVDTRAHPEWHPLSDRLTLLSSPNFTLGLETTLIARGFRPEDFAALRGYVDTHSLKNERDQGQLSLVVSAAKMAKKLHKLKRLDDAFMASYFYQKEFQFSEAGREWSAKLLEALEPQAQRVLASYLSELSTSTIIAPTPTPEAYKYEKELLLRPDLERLAKTAYEEGRL